MFAVLHHKNASYHSALAYKKMPKIHVGVMEVLKKYPHLMQENHQMILLYIPYQEENRAHFAIVRLQAAAVQACYNEAVLWQKDINLAAYMDVIEVCEGQIDDEDVDRMLDIYARVYAYDAVKLH